MQSRVPPVLTGLCVWALIAVLLLAPLPSRAVFYQKDYVVKHFDGQDVLCDPYRVREDDYVTKLLKQRGDISYKDFPKFLRIFKHVNPDVDDVDLIYPQQRILIPLRLLAPGTLAGQESGKVSIPVITITNLPEALKRYSEAYTVRYGDWVSKLISERFGDYGTRDYERGLKLFQRLNPGIDDLDQIRAGMNVRLPDPEVRSQGWYEELFERPEKQEGQMHKSKAVPVRLGPDATNAGTGPDDYDSSSAAADPPPVQWFEDLSVFAKAAEITGAELLDNGLYYFPRGNRGDFRLDLSKTPVLEFDNGTRFLFTKRQWLSPAEQMSIQEHWKDLEVMFVQGDPELIPLLENLIAAVDPDGYENRLSFEDHGVTIVLRGQFIYNNPGSGLKVCLNILSDPERRTPQAICDYLARHHIRIREWVEQENMSGWLLNEADVPAAPKRIPAVGANNPEPLVRAITQMLGYRYHENVEVSFPYAGFQVKAVTNLLSLGDQAEMLLDYGSLQGDAVRAIENTGFTVLQLAGQQDVKSLIEKLVNHLPVTYESAPVFWTAQRPRIYNTSIEVPGFLVSHGNTETGPRLLLSRAAIGELLLAYFQDAGVNVMRIRQ